ncbi:tRNA-dihydrouridine(20/20a) synthase [hydrothermal vent metagenome]|uniref:tRNA-dihydrouridine(20/20a) synthase n=1 Tax=hydrothermal vent metagenome TaxID=652676 RepID=A0A3B0Y7U7_9ZZZZ
MNRKFSVAPMLDWTDRHERYFLRLLTRKATLYTEMITTGALIYGDRPRFLEFNPVEHPLAIQLGGSDPADLVLCAKMAEAQGYDEVNLNVGCPSNRVQSGMFGACLMAKPELVAECIAAMQNAVGIPVTVKQRIGIDENDSVEELYHFVETVAEAGCKTFIIHARKAWLNGLSPKENRDIPPLRYDVVYQLKQSMPQLEIIINGGLKDMHTAQLQLEHVDGVMMGREAYHNPYILAEVDQRFYQSEQPVVSRGQVIELMLDYISSETSKGTRLHSISRHILGLFNGRPGAKKWRRYISENAAKAGADENVIIQALELVS